MLIPSALLTKSGVAIENVAVTDICIVAVVVATRAVVSCPLCGRLAHRVHSRGSLQSWGVAIVLIGLVVGNIAQTVTAMMFASPLLKAFFEQAGALGPGDIFFTLGLAIVGQFVAVYTIGATLRLQSEELQMLADPVLSTSVSRLSWAGSHLLVVAFGTALLLMGFALAAGGSYGLSTGSMTREVPRVLGAGLAYLPAVWLLGAVAIALWGIRPRLARLSWAVLIACLVIELLSELQQGSQALINLSPFTHVPRVLTGDASLVPLAGLLGVAALLTTAGLLAFRQRDIG